MEDKSQKGRWAGLKHAFAINEGRPLTDEQKIWLEWIADRTVRRGLAAPAIFMLQSAKPLNFVASQVVVFFKPIITVIFPPERCDEVAELLARRIAIETLLQMIEERDERQQREKTRTKA